MNYYFRQVQSVEIVNAGEGVYVQYSKGQNRDYFEKRETQKSVPLKRGDLVIIQYDKIGPEPGVKGLYKVIRIKDVFRVRRIFGKGSPIGTFESIYVSIEVIK